MEINENLTKNQEKMAKNQENTSNLQKNNEIEVEKGKANDANKLLVLYEDNHLIVVVKPQNLPSQADSSGDEDMLSLVKQYIKEKYHKEGEAFVGLVHRLDRPTGGIMVFAKNSKTASRLSQQIKDNSMNKIYYAVTTKVPQERKGTLINYLKKVFIWKLKIFL